MVYAVLSLGWMDVIQIGKLTKPSLEILGNSCNLMYLFCFGKNVFDFLNHWEMLMGFEL